MYGCGEIALQRYENDMDRQAAEEMGFETLDEFYDYLKNERGKYERILQSNARIRK